MLIKKECIQIRVDTKLQLKLTILIARTKFAQKGYFQSKTEKRKQLHWILNIRLILGTKFHSKQIILNFGTKFAPKMVSPVDNRKSKNHHSFLHIGISLDTKFPLGKRILNFWTKFAQKEYFRSKTKTEPHHWIPYIRISLGTNFSLRWEFWPSNIFKSTFAQGYYITSVPFMAFFFGLHDTILMSLLPKTVDTMDQSCSL